MFSPPPGGHWSTSPIDQSAKYMDFARVTLTRDIFIPGLYSVRRSTQTEMRKRIYADTCLYVERGSSVGRMPDSQSREPGFESPLLPFRSLGIFFHFTTPQSTQLYK